MSRKWIWIAVLLFAVAYLFPMTLIGDGLEALPTQDRQLGQEALAGARHHFSNPLERLWTTRFRLVSFDASLEAFIVRVYTLFGVPYAEVEVRPRGPNPALSIVRPRLWWLSRTRP